MGDALPDDQDAVSSYEALIEFLYLAPVGILKFRPNGTIDMANPTAAQLLMPLAPDGDMSNLFKLLQPLAPDLAGHVERFGKPMGQIFDQLQLAVPHSNTVLMLDINKINPATLMAVVQNITDLTEARREVVRRTEAQRILASVFMRLRTPVLIIRADGFILLSNAAFQAIIGYDGKSIVNLSIDVLLPPDIFGVVEAARLQQARDGKEYEIETDLVTKAGRHLPVTLTSCILDDAETRHLRVITVVPRAPIADDGEPGICRSVSQIRTISLSAISSAIGADWPRIASRAMMLAEAIIAPHLGRSDILKIGKGNCFIVWFADSSIEEQNAILSRAMQAIRTVFLTQFGTRIAERVRSIAI